MELVKCPYCQERYIEAEGSLVCEECIGQFEVDVALADLQDALDKLESHLTFIKGKRKLLLEDFAGNLQSILDAVKFY